MNGFLEFNIKISKQIAGMFEGAEVRQLNIKATDFGDKKGAVDCFLEPMPQKLADFIVATNTWQMVDYKGRYYFFPLAYDYIIGAKKEASGRESYWGTSKLLKSLEEVKTYIGK